MNLTSSITEETIIEICSLLDVSHAAKISGISRFSIYKLLKKRGIKIRRGKKVTIGLSHISKKYGFTGIQFGKIVALTVLGGKCVKCGCSDYRVLQFNHINGERAHEKSYKFYADICLGKSVSHLEVRCANCNVIHEFERGNRPKLVKLVNPATGHLTDAFLKAQQEFNKLKHYLSLSTNQMNLG
jgi:hypothetical protein